MIMDSESDDSMPSRLDYLLSIDSAISNLKLNQFTNTTNYIQFANTNVQKHQRNSESEFGNCFFYNRSHLRPTIYD